MSDLINYEDALSRFYKTLDLHPLPINSLDFYSLSFESSCMIERDIQTISELAIQNEWKSNALSIAQEISNDEQVVVVTNLQLQIVFASNNIWKMNRYRPDEIIGKKPKMFQGVNTCRKSLNYISRAIKEQKTFETIIVNYRKDGEPYNCWIKGEPIYNTEGKVINFIAYEKEVA